MLRKIIYQSWLSLNEKEFYFFKLKIILRIYFPAGSQLKKPSIILLIYFQVYSVENALHGILRTNLCGLLMCSQLLFILPQAPFISTTPWRRNLHSLLVLCPVYKGKLAYIPYNTGTLLFITFLYNHLCLNRNLSVYSLICAHLDSPLTTLWK